MHTLLLQVPNPADASVPDGGEDDSVVVRVVGATTEPRPYDHAEYGELMGWVDTERAAQISGPRFAYLMREATLLDWRSCNG